MDTIKNEVKEILNKYIFDKKIWTNAPENPRIILDLKINSARIVDIVLDVEEKYGIEIDDKALEKIITVEDVINTIKLKADK
ncbi:MAG: hypothetical protein A2275_13905 [Bacteroidetes bacterium RIFOXYA12_FULL_35_11]|nr:MAG: hypothetical protein A2X01_13180 [Bacteroidetes bacterium GWF2_35_48]OFY80404.1 MAG: hypothetical protein A2275_13905 [Bacteroidetes bacterium RIFOXYA12_FULL_35_11]OFY96644.1 MAG: hypothetical protein A2309_05625 [Bacteroidetes bacterium RIFOXYB2_FULL_35_7]OFZ05667.1 MAG: hypothetical protein A2491_20450 [Bacteroidetes bacterium RIFOXYC12_FULL_35_7]HBX51864.1 acyl carrier protein [Bacteroidales bacterium]